VLVGVGLPNTVAGAQAETIRSWALGADSGPFSSVSVFDRVVYDSLDPLTTLASVAMITERVRLAATVIIGPLRNTVLLAKEAATIDVLSSGRLTLAVGLGARRDDYEATGTPYAERGESLTRQLYELRECWTSQDVGPRPVLEGGPELLVGGLNDAAYARAARYCDGYIHGGGPPRAFERAALRARAAWAEWERPGHPALWGMGYFALGEQQAEAGREYLLDYYAFTGPFARRIAEGLLASPRDVVQFMRGYADAGCDHLVLFPTSGDLDQLKRLADVVG
jgi:alkanesulfonate monooxygenase SsuD/methylene tetrahydromethanopterin reductase-like flavin-dependent oxidoreductase (luciferase family)